MITESNGSISRVSLSSPCARGLVPVPYFNIIGAAGIAVGIYPIVREVLEDILQKKMTMELSMMIALSSALLIGELFTALAL